MSQETARWAANVFVQSLHKAVLAGSKPGLAQFWFDQAVLDRYRGNAAYKVIRTENVGRVKQQPSGWAVDFGIAPGERLIHTGVEQLQRLPESERGHWLAHGLSLPISQVFVQMQLSPGSCYDDGDLRPW